MIDLTFCLDEFDANRLRRAKELSELKTRIASQKGNSIYGVNSKSVIVLSYSHWEGYYNECVSSYVNCLKSSGAKVKDISWALLIGLFKPKFQSIRDKHHSSDSEVDFVNSIKDLIDRDFEGFDLNCISSRSNLDFEKLRHNYQILGFSITPFQRWRIQIDKELVGWRHSIAHGDDPDLTSANLHQHIAFTQKLLLLLSDSFQHAILESFKI